MLLLNLSRFLIAQTQRPKITQCRHNGNIQRINQVCKKIPVVILTIKQHTKDKKETKITRVSGDVNA